MFEAFLRLASCVPRQRLSRLAYCKTLESKQADFGGCVLGPTRPRRLVTPCESLFG